MPSLDPSRRVFLTEDGSSSIYSKEFGVPYHSIHGAIQETEHVFIQAGLVYCSARKSQLNIFEMGFGTGLNALATLAFATSEQIHINYQCIELHPLSATEYQGLNYLDHRKFSSFSSEFLSMHEAVDCKPTSISDNFTITKFIRDIREHHFSENSLDLIYYDAFAPTAQEELWSQSMMERLYQSLESKGVLVTYCAKGSFKRALKSAGFVVEGIPGPPRKREMTRAIKP